MTEAPLQLLEDTFQRLMEGVAKQVLGRDVAISEAVRNVRNTAEVVKRASQAHKIIALDDHT